MEYQKVKLPKEFFFFINILWEYASRIKKADWRILRPWEVGNVETCERNSSDEISEILALVMLTLRVWGSGTLQLLSIYHVFPSRHCLSLL